MLRFIILENNESFVTLSHSRNTTRKMQEKVQNFAGSTEQFPRLSLNF